VPDQGEVRHQTSGWMRSVAPFHEVGFGGILVLMFLMMFKPF